MRRDLRDAAPPQRVTPPRTAESARRDAEVKLRILRPLRAARLCYILAITWALVAVNTARGRGLPDASTDLPLGLLAISLGLAVVGAMFHVVYKLRVRAASANPEFAHIFGQKKGWGPGEDWKMNL